MRDSEKYRGPALNNEHKGIRRLLKKIEFAHHHAVRRRSLRGGKPFNIWLLGTKPLNLSSALTETWINSNSRLFHAQTDPLKGRMDVIWVHSQDPLSHQDAEILRARIAAHREVAVINHPDRYNFYHSEKSFRELEQAGVPVPHKIGRGDEYEGLAVYKKSGVQAADKWLGPYAGPKSGYRAFSFIETKWADGFYRRFRIFYLCGWVRASKLFLGRDWNVALKSTEHLYYGFPLTEKMKKVANGVHKVSGLDYFALDLLVRESDGEAFCVDINVFPHVDSLASTQRAAKRLFRMHTFGAREALGMPEPDGIPAGEAFDTALSSWMKRSQGSQRRLDVTQSSAALSPPPELRSPRRRARG